VLNALLIAVRFHDGRYHGSGEWPPSPARLFQALVAGAAFGENLSGHAVEALEWLESLEAPAIAAPSAHVGQAFKNFVPNNDLDAVDGDPSRIDKIRAGKNIRPRTFDSLVPLLYAWPFAHGADAEHRAHTICEIADKVYQLGRGVDMAWATAEIVDEAEADIRLRASGGVQWRANQGGEGATLSCPHPGSLASLVKRFKNTRARFKTVGQGKKARVLFSQAPKPNFRQVPYNSPPTLLLFDIRKDDAFAAQSLERVVALTEEIRDLATERLKASAWRRDDPKRESCIEKVFVGRDSTEADKARRVRIIPLPSIGYVHAERSIRRVLVTVPPDCSIAAGDIAWAFSGVTVAHDVTTGEVLQELVPANDRTMLAHYGAENAASARSWRTVTPAALPQRAARRRIDPRRMREEAKGGAERLREHVSAEMAVRQALRHAGIDTPVQSIRVQREPFEARGQRAETFAVSPRFIKERLWHVEIAFARPVPGPLLIGDGRYLGLGLMAPLRGTDGVLAFAISNGLAHEAEPIGLARALRRAVMALVQKKMGERATLPLFFTGHEVNGAPARSGGHRHLAFVFDLPRRRLLIVAPNILERREAFKDERQYIRTLEDAVENLCELRAGSAGKLSLYSSSVDVQNDPLFAPSRVWMNLTPYRVTRHAKLRRAATALEADLLAECRRAGLPRAQIEVSEAFGKSGLGLFGHARLTFRSAVAGPLLLGRDRHFGSGLFEAAAGN
jgi:CRISPR-associated protein Csb2